MGIDLANLREPNSKLILGEYDNQLDLCHTILKNLKSSGIREAEWVGKREAGSKLRVLIES